MPAETPRLIIDIEGGVIHNVTFPAGLGPLIVEFRDSNLEGVDADQIKTDATEAKYYATLRENP